MARGLTADREPGTLAEARAVVAYNERILETSSSSQRRIRAARMLKNLAPAIARLEQHASVTPAASLPPIVTSIDAVEFETVWNGEVGLSSPLCGSSLAPGR